MVSGTPADAVLLSINRIHELGEDQSGPVFEFVFETSAPSGDYDLEFGGCTVRLPPTIESNL